MNRIITTLLFFSSKDIKINRDKHLNGFGSISIESDSQPTSGAKDASNKPKEGYYKDFVRYDIMFLYVLAVLNTATDVLSTHRKLIELTDVVSLATQPEKWELDK